MNPEMLLSFLRDNNIIDEMQMSELLEEQSRSGKPIEEIIGEQRNRLSPLISTR